MERGLVASSGQDPDSGIGIPLGRQNTGRPCRLFHAATIATSKRPGHILKRGKKPLTHQQAAQLAEYLRQIAVHTRPDDAVLRFTIILAVANIVLAFFAFLTFAATAYMAWKTAQLAQETVDASVVADIHHQESQSGLVVWLGDRRITFLNDKIVIGGYLVNVGPGAATTITISIQGPDEEHDTNLGVFVTSLASGDAYPPIALTSAGVPQRRDYLWEFGLPQGIIRDTILNEGLRFKVKYYTVFGRERRTWYPVGGRHADAQGTHLQYFQEFIELNRDQRLASLLPTSSITPYPDPAYTPRSV
jgi:hypothetical protein